MNKAQLVAEINALVLTGGNRTSAANVRQVLTDMVTFLEDQTTSTSGIIAESGGGQFSATILKTKYNRVDVSGADGDSVVLPPAVAGMECFVQNYSSFAVDCFPNGIDNFFGQAASLALRIAASNQVRLYCYTTGEWSQI
jgi:hypothetical protein